MDRMMIEVELVAPLRIAEEQRLAERRRLAAAAAPRHRSWLTLTGWWDRASARADNWREEARVAIGRLRSDRRANRLPAATAPPSALLGDCLREPC